MSGSWQKFPGEEKKRRGAAGAEWESRGKTTTFENLKDFGKTLENKTHTHTLSHEYADGCRGGRV